MRQCMVSRFRQGSRSQHLPENSTVVLFRGESGSAGPAFRIAKQLLTRAAVYPILRAQELTTGALRGAERDSAMTKHAPATPLPWTVVRAPDQRTGTMVCGDKPFDGAKHAPAIVRKAGIGTHQDAAY